MLAEYWEEVEAEEKKQLEQQEALKKKRERPRYNREQIISQLDTFRTSLFSAIHDFVQQSTETLDRLETDIEHKLAARKPGDKSHDGKTDGGRCEPDRRDDRRRHSSRDDDRDRRPLRRDDRPRHGRSDYDYDESGPHRRQPGDRARRRGDEYGRRRDPRGGYPDPHGTVRERLDRA